MYRAERAGATPPALVGAGAAGYGPAVLTCVHHVQWVREIPGGLHQCIQCHQVVGRKDVHPKLEDLPPEFRRRWDEHEATRPAAGDAASGGDAGPPGRT